MTTAIEARGLSKRYGRRYALNDCTLTIPAGRVVGLVGPNGAGKSTLLQLALGLIAPTSGSIGVLGDSPVNLRRVGYVAQDTPSWASLSIADHLQMGRRLNPAWNSALAQTRVADLGLDLKQRAGTLSGGQRAQLALTLAIAKRPELLILDEPTAALDPLARREFARSLMAIVAEHNVSVVLSSHLLSDLARMCDYLVVLASSQVQVSGNVDDLLSSHHRLTGPHRHPLRLPTGQELIEAHHTARQSTLLIRTTQRVLDPAWHVEEVELEELVLAYMARSTAPATPQTGPAAVAS